MSKYRGPRLRIVRRFGELPRFTRKRPNRSTRPGQHGENRRKLTQFATRLTEKQKLRFHYGVSEKQIIRYVKDARRVKGSTRKALVRNLEIRLDNTVYRIGWGITVPRSRQIVSHGNILVNQACVNIPCFPCAPNQTVKIQAFEKIHEIVKKNLQEYSRIPPSHIYMSSGSLTAVVKQWANLNDSELDTSELLIIEYYSNRL